MNRIGLRPSSHNQPPLGGVSRHWSVSVHFILMKEDRPNPLVFTLGFKPLERSFLR